MLRNLKKALREKNISMKAFAAILDISEKTLWNKINEETSFTYPEVKKTKKYVLPEYDIDYLFQSDLQEKGA